MNRKCACGCGHFARKENRFILGHFWKNKKRPEISGKNNPMWNKHHSKETRKKMSKSHTGKNNYWYGKKRPNISGKYHPNWGKENKWGYHSKKNRKKMSLTKKNWYKKHPRFSKGKNNPMFGKENKWGHHTKDARRKISLRNKGKIRSKETRKLMSKNNARYWLGKKRPDAALRCIEMNMKGFKPSKFEKRIMRLIKQNHLPWKYIGDGREGSFFGKVPDFICTNGQKAFAEAYDDYWKEEDYVPKRRRYFAKFGFKTKFIHYKDSDEKIVRVLGFNSD